MLPSPDSRAAFREGSRIAGSAAARFGNALALALGGMLLYSGLASSAAAAIALSSAIALTAWRPIVGPMVVAALAPLASIAGGTFLPAQAAWAEALVLSVLCGVFLRGVAGRWRWAGGTAAVAAIVLIATYAASAIVQLSVLRLQLSPSGFVDAVVATVPTYLTTGSAVADVLRPAAYPIEALALFLVVFSCPQEAAVRVLRMAVVGACGAAALNLTRLIGSALRADAPVAALVELLRTIRIGIPFPDVNAAGSYFALAVGLAAGLAVITRRSARAGWIGAALLTCAAVWTSGSRTAVLAILVTLVGGTLLARGRAVALWVVLGVAALGAILVAVVPNPLAGRNTGDALRMRGELARAAVRMMIANPAFGVGVGQFYERSYEFIHRPVDKPMYVRENAHNNFLQVLGELGLVGFVAFVTILGASALRLVQHVRARDGGLTAGIAALGLAAFVLTWFTGHPLLIPEIAFVFWIVLGTVSMESAPVSGPQLTRRLAIGALVAIAASVPFRIVAAMRDANLEHRGYGVSSWSVDPSGVRYRSMQGEEVTLFVPRDARVAEVPYRLEAPGPPVMLHVSLRGEAADRLTVSETAWRSYRFVIQPRSGDPRFIRLTLTMDPNAASRVLLGKVEARAADPRK